MLSWRELAFRRVSPGAARRPTAARSRRARRAWAAVWPLVAALLLGLAGWQALAWSGWRPEYVLPGPGPVLDRLWQDLWHGDLLHATAITLQRAALGYAIALALGTVFGLLMVRVRLLRAALAPLVTGLQSMPSVAWFPLAILLFRLSEAAILFVVVLGAAPAIANGLLAGVDHIPPLVVRAGRVLGAHGWKLYRHVLLPAALPGFVTGLKQGWAFAWRSLMAGELLVIIPGRPSLGVQLQFARELSDAAGLLAAMIVVLLIGVALDGLLFGRLEHGIRARRGLLDPGA